MYHSPANQKIDALLRDYSFNEYHEVMINASVEDVKHALHATSVADIPAVLFLLKIRGIANDKEKQDGATNNKPCTDSLSTPEFKFIVADPAEFLTVMILKASAKAPPPEITTAEQFMAFNEQGYVKVAINFRFISLGNKQTLLTTETRNLPITSKDRLVFGRYWRIIYPGSAIIRRVWLDALAKKAEKSEQGRY